jgi:hypothetical protein
MRRPACALALALALALTGLAGAGGEAGAVQPSTMAQAASAAPDEDDSQERSPEAADDQQGPAQGEDRGLEVPPRLGEVRRMDAFDAVDDEGRRHAPHQAALDYPDHDVVVCEAGCDKTAGSIVYMKRRE